MTSNLLIHGLIIKIQVLHPLLQGYHQKCISHDLQQEGNVMIL